MNKNESNQESSWSFTVFRALPMWQLCFGIVLLVIISLAFYWVSRDLAQGLEDDLRKAFDQQNLTVVDIASSRVGFHIDNDVAENVRLLGQFPAMQRLELNNGTRDMKKVNAFAAPRVDGFVLFDAKGVFLSASAASMRFIYNGDQSDKPFFQAPKETGSLYFSDWIHDGEHLKMRVSSPIYNRIVDKNFPPPDHQFAGVVLAQIDFDRTIATELGRLKASGMMHWIVDEHTGEVLYHSVLPRDTSDRVVDSENTRFAKDLLHAFKSTILEPGIHRANVDGKGISVAAARSKVGPHRIIVNLAYDDTEVSSLVREKTNRIYLLGAAFLLSIIIGAMIVLRQMVKRQSLLGEKEHLSRELALEDEKKKLSEQVFQLQKMESLGELAAGTAHELNNALTGPMATVGLLQLKPDLTSDKRKNMLKSVMDGMEQARAIVDGLLRFSRTERNEKQLGDINDDIQFVLQMYQKELDHAGIHLQTNLQKHLLQVHAAHRQLQQVILNLVTNAKYVLQRGGTITVVTEAQQRDGREGVLLTVSDNGPGIDAESQKRIFDPFFSTKPVGEGTGLGLSICYGIVQDHDGEMRVHSVEGEGASFTIWLPEKVQG
ncbi:MAG: ATP-binding protein [Mariprofundales bacterium]